MIPAAFTYHAPDSLRAARRILREHEGEARVLAGGMSLVPAMKLRLVQPEHVVDVGRIPELARIARVDGGVEIGAAATYRSIERSRAVAGAAPLLIETVGTVGDLQVRNRGTLGGSAAHADPAADAPAALLALDAQMRILGGARPRSVPAARFFVDSYETAIGPAEILASIFVPRTPRGAGSAYVKFANKASRFAIVGVAAVVTPDRNGRCASVRVAVTGAGPVAARARAAERALAGRPLDAESIARAASRAGDGVEFLTDIHGSAEYRAHLTQVIARRALEAAAARAAA